MKTFLIHVVWARFWTKIISMSCGISVRQASLNDLSVLLQLENSPFHYESHVKLIKALRDVADLDGARRARETMSKIFPLTPGDEMFAMGKKLCSRCWVPWAALSLIMWSSIFFCNQLAWNGGQASSLSSACSSTTKLVNMSLTGQSGGRLWCIMQFAWGMN